MSSPGAALALSFSLRHRWGLVAIGVTLLAVAAVKVVTVFDRFPLDLDPQVSFAIVCTVPMSLVFFYLVAVLTFGLDGDLAARQSMYPARMFSWPVTSTALAWWPMAFGTVITGLLWTLTRQLAVWPPSIQVPVVWPGLLAVVLLAWAQALTWMPYGLRGVRVVIVSLWLVTIDTIVLLALYLNASEPVMAAVLVPQIPLAYLAGRYAVTRARCGDIPDWALGSRISALGLGPSAESREPRAGFASPLSAQTWFEWRRAGRSLPVWVALVIPFELLLFWAVGTSTKLLVEFLVIVFATPIILAAFTAATVSTSSLNATPGDGLPAFLATRPLTSADLIAAKLWQTIRSTLLAWLVVIVSVAIGLVWSGASAVVVERVGALAHAIGTPRVVALALLVLVGFVASTWKQQVQSLYIGLTGREWLIKGSVFVTLTFLLFFALFIEWIVDTDHVGQALSALPRILAVLAAIKMLAAVWIALRMYRSRLVRDSTLVIGAACWCATVVVLFGVFVWFFSTPMIPHYFLLLIAILATPLVRLSAALMALAWNRHR